MWEDILGVVLSLSQMSWKFPNYPDLSFVGNIHRKTQLMTSAQNIKCLKVNLTRNVLKTARFYF